MDEATFTRELKESIDLQDAGLRSHLPPNEIEPGEEVRTWIGPFGGLRVTTASGVYGLAGDGATAWRVRVTSDGTAEMKVFRRGKTLRTTSVPDGIGWPAGPPTERNQP